MPGRILVSGLVNLETSLKVEAFPVEYQPSAYPFFGVTTAVSGVGFNHAKALLTLGDSVNLIGVVGPDFPGRVIISALEETRRGLKHGNSGLHDPAPQSGTFDFSGVVCGLAETAQSVVMYDGSGRRRVNADLKDAQDFVYPAASFDALADGCSAAMLSNVNFNRPLLSRARALGLTIVTDVQAIHDLDDPYNSDYMSGADFVFMSDEKIGAHPVDWARAVLERHDCSGVVVGMGGMGALLALGDGTVSHCPAFSTRPVLNTVGAGDSLAACFTHYLVSTGDPFHSLERACLFASWKIGARNASEGLLTEAELEGLAEKLQS